MIYNKHIPKNFYLILFANNYIHKTTYSYYRYNYYDKGAKNSVAATVINLLKKVTYRNDNLLH